LIGCRDSFTANFSDAAAFLGVGLRQPGDGLPEDVLQLHAEGRRGVLHLLLSLRSRSGWASLIFGRSVLIALSAHVTSAFVALPALSEVSVCTWVWMPSRALHTPVAA
jgi:hypothetical protein